MTFAAPCVGNFDFNEEYKALEKRDFLRHVRISNEGDLVPTNNIIPPFSIIIKGNTKVYTQNGVNLLLRSDDKLVAEYRNTSRCGHKTNSTFSIVLPTTCCQSMRQDWANRSTRQFSSKLSRNFTRPPVISLTEQHFWSGFPGHGVSSSSNL